MINISASTSSICLNGTYPDGQYDGTYEFQEQINYRNVEGLVWNNTGLGKQVYPRYYGTFDKEVVWQLGDSYTSDANPYMKCGPAVAS